MSADTFHHFHPELAPAVEVEPTDDQSDRINELRYLIEDAEDEISSLQGSISEWNRELRNLESSAASPDTVAAWQAKLNAWNQAVAS